MASLQAFFSLLFAVMIHQSQSYSSADESNEEESNEETVIVGPYNLGHLITCYEQNKEDPDGFVDPVYTDPNSPECLESDALCNRYQNEGPNPGQGDVCDHTDPRSLRPRDTCYFNVHLLPEVDIEVSWSYKCWEKSQCRLQDENGDGMLGCQVLSNRINCCCQTDFCNSDELIRKFAQWGSSYPPDFDAMCDYDFGDWTVVFKVPGYEHCGSGGPAAKTQAETRFIHDMSLSTTASTESVPLSVSEIALVFTYFMVATVFLALGIFVGVKWQSSVSRQQQQFLAQNKMKHLDM